MSWSSEPDAEPTRKYGTRDLTTNELVDFITGPLLPTVERTLVPGVQIRFDQRHSGMLPNFFERGTYKFVVQVSAHETPPDELTLLVHWRENGLTIRADGTTYKIV
jgi:hypothetical protein